MDLLQKRFQRIKQLLNLAFFRILFFAALGVILFLSMYSNVKPEQLKLGLFDIAEKTVVSPITVEDKESTEAKRKEELNRVQAVYTLKSEYSKNQVDLVGSIFDSAIKINQEEEELKKTSEEPDDTEPKPEVKGIPIADKVKKLKERLTQSVIEELPQEVFSAMVSADNTQLAIAKDLTITAISNEMGNRIPADEVENAKKRVEEELKYTTMDSNLKQASIQLGRFAVIQNEFYDPQATEEKRRQMSESIEPVKILEGQVIVEEGELVTHEIYRQLNLTRLLDSQDSKKPFIGLALLIVIILSAFYYYFTQQKKAPDKKQTNLLLFGIVFSFSIIVMKIVSQFQQLDYEGISYLFPAAMAGMILTILIDEKLAWLTAVVQAICGSIIFNEEMTGTLNMSAGIYLLCGGLAATFLLKGQNARSKILQAGLFASLVNLAIVFTLLFLRNTQYSGVEYGLLFLFAAVSGIASAVLALGILPFLEMSFGILSTMKLIELSNPNHPLLKKILTEAPGTYHHSVMVANMSEAACEAIGANGLLARVGCYYHDIGKTKRPVFFIENQVNRENPHDRLSPQKSAQIIIAHATDAAAMLKKHRMPKEIIDIAEQHHGTSLIKYFYHKANQAGGAKESDYRYPGPKAQTKETAIIAIADSVEAAVRSMSHPTPEQIESLVHSIISDKLQDGQLNDCDLTLREIEMVAHTLCDTLKGIFHSRIEYPTEITKQKVIQV
ncbi:HDIG domain-containing protein [Neobacillus notoginsengisoli]|uniref:HDIG domain-containing protein n=1 Tax=Neobacillus notoginsengisoli TaxID=1578198 RepID=A0A417YUP7_9BACI|nr:HD family phosphohydrolase [Neobacillus notoginsengisoli]RHW41021.1 HDIG domain-containing protein [Neobacillus notoginsengisoli]